MISIWKGRIRPKNRCGRVRTHKYIIPFVFLFGEHFHKITEHSRGELGKRGEIRGRRQEIVPKSLSRVSDRRRKGPFRLRDEAKFHPSLGTWD
jgi:hypothetical protein